MTRSRKLSRYIPSSANFAKDEFPFYWLARLNNLYVMKMEAALKKVDADVPGWRVLNILRENGTSSISEIALHAVAKLSTVTKIVYRMKDQGLVETGTSAEDGRVTEVSITPAGLALSEQMKQATAKLFQKSFRGLTDAQIQRLNRTLTRLFANLDED